MDYFIHPIVLHFPIALLVLYGVMEIISTKRMERWVFWFPIKALLVIVGALSGIVTIITGEMAERIFLNADNAEIIAKHAFFAKGSIVIFMALAAAYFVAWFKQSNWKFLRLPILSTIWRVALWLQHLLSETILAKALALVGIIGLMITGALGGSMAFGPSTDPLTSWIYHWFFN